ncbi:MAG: hypothetical protein AVDCRST_MAG32-41, partial [uncultured Nocardioides sp.]
ADLRRQARALRPRPQDGRGVGRGSRQGGLPGRPQEAGRRHADRPPRDPEQDPPAGAAGRGLLDVRLRPQPVGADGLVVLHDRPVEQAVGPRERQAAGRPPRRHARRQRHVACCRGLPGLRGVRPARHRGAPPGREVADLLPAGSQGGQGGRLHRAHRVVRRGPPDGAAAPGDRADPGPPPQQVAARDLPRLLHRRVAGEGGAGVRRGHRPLRLHLL